VLIDQLFDPIYCVRDGNEYVLQNHGDDDEEKKKKNKANEPLLRRRHIRRRPRGNRCDVRRSRNGR